MLIKRAFSGNSSSGGRVLRLSVHRVGEGAPWASLRAAGGPSSSPTLCSVALLMLHGHSPEEMQFCFWSESLDS